MEVIEKIIIVHIKEQLLVKATLNWSGSFGVTVSFQLARRIKLWGKFTSRRNPNIRNISIILMI